MFNRRRGTYDTGRPRKMGSRLAFLVPFILALVAFVLSLLVLLAGYKPGFMSDTNIVLLDTSRFGEDLLTLRRSILVPRQSLADDIADKLDDLSGDVQDKIDAAKDKFNDAKDDVIGRLKEAVGVEQFYTLHAMTVCSGNYINKNNSSGGLNVTRCTAPLQEVDVLNVVAGDVRIPGPIRDAVDEMVGDVPKILQVLGGFYVASAALCGLSMLASLASGLLASGDGRMAHFANLGLASLAALALLVASVGSTVGGDQAARLVREKAGSLGMRAEVGGRLRGMSWAAFALMVVAAVYFVFQVARALRRGRGRRGGGAIAAPKKSSMGGSTRGGSYETSERRGHRSHLV